MLRRRLSLLSYAPFRQTPHLQWARCHGSGIMAGNSGSDGAPKRTSGGGGNNTKRSQATEFALLVPGIQAFHAATGHFLVPYHFPIAAMSSTNKGDAISKIAGVVEDPSLIDWPAEVRGLNLGRVLHNFMTHHTRHHAKYPLVVQALRTIRFPVDDDWKKYLWQKLTMKPLTIYYQAQGNSNVPTDFVVPHGNDKWPTYLWGYRLGKRVQRLRRICESLTHEEVDDLQNVEFQFDVLDLAWSGKILPALEMFAKLNGHCVVKSSFVVPAEAPWPQKAWRLKLGVIVKTIRARDGYAKQVARDAHKLEQIDFVWNHRQDVWAEALLPSLEVFYKQYGHTRIERSFVVPAKAPWPRKAYGLALGVSVNHIRASGAYAQEIEQDMDRIQAIQFIWSMREYKWKELIVPALESFVDRFGHCRVPKDFVVPSTTEDLWPQEAWGAKLGSIVDGIRNHGTYASFVADDEPRLRAMGFFEVEVVE